MADRRDHWTPVGVRGAIVEALRWHRQAVRGAGPSGVRSSLPPMAMRIEDRLAEGWDSVREDEVDRDIVLYPSRPQIARYEAALEWVADILRPIDEDAARAVNAVCFSEAYGVPLKKVAAERGLSRAWAHTLGERGLVIISTKLEARGVPVWRTKN